MSGVIPLWVNLKGSTAKPRTGGTAKPASHGESRRSCGILSGHRSGHHGFFYQLRKGGEAGGDLTHKGRDAALSRTSPHDFERLHVPGNPERERGRYWWCIFKIRANILFCIRAGNAGGGLRPSRIVLGEKQHPLAFLVAQVTLLSALNLV